MRNYARCLGCSGFVRLEMPLVTTGRLTPQEEQEALKLATASCKRCASKARGDRA